MQKARVISIILAGPKGSVDVDIIGKEVEVLHAAPCPDMMARMVLGITDSYIVAIKKDELTAEQLAALTDGSMTRDLVHYGIDTTPPEGTVVFLSDSRELELI